MSLLKPRPLWSVEIGKSRCELIVTRGCTGSNGFDARFYLLFHMFLENLNEFRKGFTIRNVPVLECEA
jgi:hypothetical protein